VVVVETWSAVRVNNPRRWVGSRSVWIELRRSEDTTAMVRQHCPSTVSQHDDDGCAREDWLSGCDASVHFSKYKSHQSGAGVDEVGWEDPLWISTSRGLCVENLHLDMIQRRACSARVNPLIENVNPLIENKEEDNFGREQMDVWESALEL
jgi:hypothetical protein